MKIFWAIVLLLVAAAAVVWLRPQAAAPTPLVDAGPAALPPAAEPRAAASVPAETPPPVPPAPAQPPTATAPQTPAAPRGPEVVAAAPTAAPAPVAPASTAPTADEAKAAAEKAAKELSAKLAAHLDEQVSPIVAPVLPQAATTPAGAAADAAHPSSDKAAAALSLVKQDDGTTLVDNRFTLSGAGTKDDPYRVSWEMLMSAQDTYQPRLGRKVIPERLKMLDGKWVKIGGYIAFPIMAQSQDEMLMMLNQWDGCCIGVPPTPYDAIEVKLKDAAKGDERFRVTGTVTGILRIDPYLVKDWLVSMFLMDDATLSGVGGTQPGGQHSK